MADSPTVPAPGADHDRETLTAAQGLTDSLNGMTRELGRLRAYGKTNRRIITGLIVSICLDLLVTAGFGYNTVRVNDAQNTSHTSLISGCQQANANRAQDIAIWNRFLADLVPASARTAKVKAELAGLNALIKVKDTPRDCQKLYAK